MGASDRTYRDVDGERIEGTWRPAFIRNGDTYFLTDLKIYADGVVDCWELVTFEQFVEKVRSGWVATTLPDGARASAHHLADWKFSDPTVWVSQDELIGEVADEIDALAGRPDSTNRCLAAADVYRQDQTEENRAALREAYLAIPEHLRLYALGDMDRKDGPLRALAFDMGEQARQSALAYFAESEQELEEYESEVPADGPVPATTVIIPGIVHVHGLPEDPGLVVLQNRYPAPITVAGATYPSVTHAYWALSTPDEQIRARIAETEKAYEVEMLARRAPRREGWAAARLSIMTALLRAKYRQHPHLAEVLLSTGEARLVTHENFPSRYWGEDGRNWTARLLELTRSELAAETTGLNDL